jgi:hydroxyacylglutathione hydrolase
MAMIFEGTPQQMFQSLQTLKNLPDNTQVFCGHEYTLNNLAFAATAEPSNIDIFKRIEAVTAIRNQGLPSLPSLIKIEKEVNPFLRCDSPEIIANVEKYADKKLVDPVEVFQYLREWKNHF